MTINKKDVLLLHHFGLIDDPDIAKSVDQWIAVDPVAQVFIDRLDPDYEEPSAELQSCIDSIVRDVELSILLDQIVCGDLKTLDASQQAILSADFDDAPFERISTSLEVSMAAAPNNSSEVPRTVRSDRERLIVDLGRREIRIQYPTSDIPFGLAWIYYTSPSGRLTRALLELSWDAFKGKTNWIGTLSISSLTDDKSAGTSSFSVIPVTEGQRDDAVVFATLSEFVARLAESKQKTMAESFLKNEFADGESDE